MENDPAHRLDYSPAPARGVPTWAWITMGALAVALVLMVALLFGVRASVTVAPPVTALPVPRSPVTVAPPVIAIPVPRSSFTVTVDGKEIDPDSPMARAIKAKVLETQGQAK